MGCSFGAVLRNLMSKSYKTFKIRYCKELSMPFSTLKMTTFISSKYEYSHWNDKTNGSETGMEISQP